ncbi:hypothetical protein OHS18_09030 [Amycolatopsis sp. NBC_00355]|uniref:hypothetical protein n=1 Tax=Amycolatopsis sp. NBC_00355 TaxID=2975957 RepID=UPI002E257A32
MARLAACSRGRTPSPRSVERAINGVELPGYAGVPDSGASAGPPTTSSARPSVMPMRE